MTAIPTSIPVGVLATQHPEAMRVLANYRIDYWRRGATPLDEACVGVGCHPDEVLREIVLAESEASGHAIRWDQKPLAELIDFIVEQHHRPLQAELDKLQVLADEVFSEESKRFPELVPGLVELFGYLREELVQHMLKEERIVFRMIKTMSNYLPRVPVEVLLGEHDIAAILLMQLADLTDGFTPPEGAGAHMSDMYAGLEAMVADLQEHTHLENNILFPRALDGTKAVPA